MPLDIQRRHLSYAEWTDAADFLWTSYIGGRPYHDSEWALDKYPRELDIIYAERQKRAYLLNHFASTIDAYVASVFRRDPVREGATDEDGNTVTELPTAMQEFIEDATGTGDDLNTFSRDIATFALSAERAFVGVDIQTGGRPYAYQIHPSNILDYSEDPTTGELRWVLVAEVEIDDSDPLLDRVVLDRFRLWTPQEWTVFDKEGNGLDSGRNTAGVVPIVFVPGYSVRLPVYDISLIQKRIYNLSSQLDEILNNSTFPMLYVPAAEGTTDVSTIETEFSQNGTEHPLVMGPARVLELPTDKDLNSVIPGWLAPPDGPAKVIMDERHALVDAIASLAGLERRDPDQISPQSGVAKAYDFRETNERLVSLAQVMEEFEVALFDLMNAYGVGGEVNVTYRKDFQVRDFQAMTDTFEKLQDFKLPPIVKKRAALDYSMALAEEADEDEKREIRDAIENMTEFDAPEVPEANGNGVVPRSRLADLLGSNNQQTEEEGGNE